MENFNVIEFHKTRDFSTKMNATFEFVKQNFKPLSKSILFIAGPPVLIASLMMGSFMGDFMGMAMGSARGGDPTAFTNYFTSPALWLNIGLAMIFFIVSGVVTISTINNYIMIYGERRSNNIEVAEVWERVRSTFWMYLGTMILVTILLIVMYVVVVIPVVLLAMVSPWLIFFGVIFVIVGIFYVTISSSLIFFIRGYEKTNFFDAVLRSFKLVRGKWWSTFGLIMVLYLIVGTVSSIFYLPWYFYTLMSMMHNVQSGSFTSPSTGYQAFTMIFLSLYYLAQMILYSLPNVGIAFQYFNLVEMKEARGLMGQIETLGQGSAPAEPSDEHY
jgi:hypothetical protein